MDYLSYEDITALRPKLTDEEYIEILHHNYPSTWVEEYIPNPLIPDANLTLREYQMKILNSHGTKKILRMGRQIGKCIDENSIIYTSDNMHITAKELYAKYGKKHIPFKILSMNQETFNMEHQEAFIEDNGIADCVNIKTRSGYDTTPTVNHPFMIWRDESMAPEWIDAKDIKEGDRIATINDLYSTLDNDNDDISVKEAELLGLLTGDGGLNSITPTFTSKDEELPNRIQYLLTELKYNNKVNSRKDPITYSIVTIDNANANNMKELLIKHKLYGKTSHTKDIPSSIMAGSKQVIAAYLSGIWATDGYVTIDKNNTVSIGIGLCNENLIRQIRYLLLRIGIFSRVRYKPVKYNEGTNDSWTLSILDKHNIQQFAVAVYMQLSSKRQTIKMVLDLINNKEANSNTSTLPKGIWNIIEDIVDTSGKTKRQHIIDSGLDPDMIRIRTCYSPQLNTIKKVHTIADDPKLSCYLNDDIYWDEVKSVTHVGNRQTYAVSVPNTQVLVNDGFISHNTFLIVSLILYHGIRDKTSRMLVVGPQKIHIDNIFDEITRLVADSPYLQSQIKSSVKQPRKITFKSGATVVGYTTGETSGGQGLNIRGTTANILFVDEADYVNDMVMEQAIIPTTNAFDDPIIYLSSTPSGKKGFFRRTWDAGYYETFHYKSSDSPAWNKQKEAEIRSTITKLSYTHEYDAEWGDAESGLFSKDDMRAIEEKSILTFKDPSMPEGIINRQYTYKDDQITLDELIQPKTRILGVDWNKSTNGTRLVWCDFDQYHNMYVRAKWKIDSAEFTQNVAMSKIIELHETLKFDYIMVDVGYGSVQIEDLHLYGLQHKSTKLDEIVKGVPTDSFMEIQDIATGEKRKTPVKNFIVESMVRFMEQRRLRIPKEENISEGQKKSKKSADTHTLFDQLANFVIDKYTANGRPVYKCDLKDHDIDAAMFTLYGYITEVIKTQDLWSKSPSVRARTISHERLMSMRSKTRNKEDIGTEMVLGTKEKLDKNKSYKSTYVSDGYASRTINRTGGRSGGRFGGAGRSSISRSISR